jgi:hypothetical protein
MEDHVADPEDLGPIQFLDERLATVSEAVLLGRAEVDEIVGMDHGAP